MSPENQSKSLIFGSSDPNAINHPKDEEWIRNFVPGTDQSPPLEHFIFTPEQKAAINDKIAEIS